MTQWSIEMSMLARQWRRLMPRVRMALIGIASASRKSNEHGLALRPRCCRNGQTREYS